MVASRRSGPLPDHTKLNYYECCAKLVLEDLFPERYGQLVLADKPDLQGDGIGVEVTIADDRNKQEAVSNWVKAYNCTDPKKQRNYIKRMNQLGVEYSGGVQGWPGFNTSPEVVLSAVEKKVKTLKKGQYKCFPCYELFVHTNIWVPRSEVRQVYSAFFDLVDSFSVITILCQGSELHRFDIDNKQYSFLELDNSEQTRRNIRARQIVEDGERE